MNLIIFIVLFFAIGLLFLAFDWWVVMVITNDPERYAIYSWIKSLFKRRKK